MVCKTRTEHPHAAKRWAVEAERRFEVITDLIVEVRRHATTAGTDWAGLAAEGAEEAMR